MSASSASSQRHHPTSRVTCGLLAPCGRALVRLFRVPASAALSIRAFRFRSLRKAAARMSPSRRRRRRLTFRSVRAVFWPLVPASSSSSTLARNSTAGEDGHAARGDEAREPEEEAVVAAEASMLAPAPLPSPETPAYMKAVARLRSGRRSAAAVSGDGGEEVGGEGTKEEACWSFESCLMEMLVEEGKARDLQDVEELLRCWERLKSPVFVELVCRFYGELCNDLFPVDRADDGDEADMDGGDGSASTSAP